MRVCYKKQKSGGNEYYSLGPSAVFVGYPILSMTGEQSYVASFYFCRFLVEFCTHGIDRAWVVIIGIFEYI